MEGKDRRQILDRIFEGAGFLLIGIAVATFLYYLPSSSSEYHIIKSVPTVNYLIFNFTLSSGIFYLILTGVIGAMIIGLSTFIVRSRTFSKGFTGRNDIGFFHFFSIYVLTQLIFSSFVEYFIPSLGKEFPYNMSFAAQNFFISSSILVSTFLFDFIPILVFLCIYLAVVGKFNIKNVLNYPLDGRNIAFIAMILSILVTAIERGPIVIIVSDLFIIFVLNIIILKFGFFKGFISYFSLSMAGLAETAIASYSLALSLVVYLILLVIGFLGIYALFSISMVSQRSGDINTQDRSNDATDGVEKASHTRGPSNTPKIDLFVRCQCPNCGNTSFHVIGDMTLKCSRCEYEMDKNTTGIPNITIEYRRNIGF